MKRLIVFGVALSLIISVFAVVQATDKDAIVGTWLTQDKDGKVKIQELNGKYVGRLIWMKDPYEADGKTPKKDTKNPNSSLKGQPLQNMMLMAGFVYKGDNLWKDGQIYDPNEGKTYSCQMKLKKDGSLEVTGYVGFSFIGRTVNWTKVK